MRLFVAAALFAVTGLVVLGCSPQPQTVSNPTFQLKPLPPPGSPADGAKGKGGDGEGKRGDRPGRGTTATHP